MKTRRKRKKRTRSKRGRSLQRREPDAGMTETERTRAKMRNRRGSKGTPVCMKKRSMHGRLAARDAEKNDQTKMRSR